MPTLHVTACHAAAPIACPVVSPRTVSITAVAGCDRAKPCSQEGIVDTGTNALLGYGRKLTRNVTALAASAERTATPTAAANHDIASAYKARMPAAPAHRVTSTGDRKPIANATSTTRIADTKLRTTLATT